MPAHGRDSVVDLLLESPERLESGLTTLDARLALLTAQIEPHFLFNTLANVQALVESGSPRAATVLRSLIAYLRAAMPRLQDARVSVLRDELDLHGMTVSAAERAVAHDSSFISPRPRSCAACRSR